METVSIIRELLDGRGSRVGTVLDLARQQGVIGENPIDIDFEQPLHHFDSVHGVCMHAPGYAVEAVDECRVHVVIFRMNGGIWNNQPAWPGAPTSRCGLAAPIELGVRGGAAA